ncbi:BAG domain-containing protein [Mycena maculata]|uniref:BAG domain-containing protein n=1 Tax=Mycena maculata TaxID=230809 RepID=A0AAD7K8C9_9AGAR|nr:BAG domain-containing protein [Mycena maculata]
MVHLKWNTERFSFDLPAPSTPLSDIRTSVAACIHLPRDSFKLIHKGAVMKDDTAPISSYQLRQSSTIQVVEIGPPPSQPQQPLPPKQPPKQHKPAAPVRTEQATISTIQTELANVRAELSPAVDQLLASAVGQQNPKPKEHIRLSELLLQALLRLDAITTDGEWEAARKERKAAVKEVQALLDRLDDGGG